MMTILRHEITDRTVSPIERESRVPATAGSRRVTGDLAFLRAGTGARATGRPGAAASAARASSDGGARLALRRHWPEYLIEAGGLGVFMLSACLFTTLLEYPGSPVRQAVVDAMLRRIPMGLAMGLTAVAIIYSPLGQRSGAHLNPAVTLTFWRLGKVRSWDAAFYVLAQFVGGIGGVGLARVLLGGWLADPAVNYAATVPGAWGIGVAFAAEGLMTFVLMTAVLTVSNRPHLNRFTGFVAGALVASYIVFEAPLSGMSLNPARTVGSAAYAHVWTALWMYGTAPLLGMLAAAQLYIRARGLPEVRCAKLHHENLQPCIFRCHYDPHRA